MKVSGRLAERLAKEHPQGAIWANQFDNVANRQGHIETTGPEIWEQTDGKVDGFTCAVGTGGTLAGVGMALKARNKDVKIALADPMGAALLLLLHDRRAQVGGNSITEGIGQGRITANLVDAPIDLAFQITRRRGAADRVRSRRTRGPAARRLVGRQRRGRDAAGEGIGPGPHDRDDPVRFRRAVCVEALQPGVFAGEEFAGSGVDGAQGEH